MVATVRDVMTLDPVILPPHFTIRVAARKMRRLGIRDVVVADERNVCGVVSDRDIVERAVAEGFDSTHTSLLEICRCDYAQLAPTDTVDDARRIMRDQSVSRLPVVDDGTVVGLVALSDLAAEAAIRQTVN
jgi:CBS domain-containing protein